MAAYDNKFHVLSRYTTQLVTTEEERIQLCIRGLSSEVQYFLFIRLLHGVALIKWKIMRRKLRG